MLRKNNKEEVHRLAGTVKSSYGNGAIVTALLEYCLCPGIQAQSG